MVQGDRYLQETEPFDPACASRPAAVARARALLAAGASVGSYVLAGAILDETMRAVCWGRPAGLA
ncbi:MAG TPA: hypothetical protein VFW24_15325 [Acidimicrobiales bacterium]|nr:hypothetical protein [Acidimicrobiales bacterium]